MQITIEIDEKDVREAIASVPAPWFEKPVSAVMKVAAAVKDAYQRQAATKRPIDD